MASDSSPTFISPVNCKKKAYSVSLQERNLDISEVPLPDHEAVTIENRGHSPPAGTCPYCGQDLWSRGLNENVTNQHSLNERRGNQFGNNLPSSAGRNLPVYEKFHNLSSK